MMQEGFFNFTNGSQGAPTTGLQGGPSPLRYSNEDIRRMVDRQERDFEPLHRRMEEDYRRYRLERHVLKDVVTKEPLEDYAVYTSSEPRAFANKIISWMTQAALLMRVQHVNDRQHPPQVDNLKENLIVGLLNAADERLTNTLSPKLVSALAFTIAVRGGFVGGRCLLAKRPDGSTYVDITPWDPAHIFFGRGNDGLAWVCYKIRKTRQEIQDEYGVVLGGGTPTLDGSKDAETAGVDVYDFYDSRINTVITAAETLKPPTPHGSPRVPAYLVLVGNTPWIQSPGVTSIVADIGESVYEASRRTYDIYNDAMSIMLELVERASRQGHKVFSPDGTKTLPEDPNKQGTDVSLMTDKEDVVPLGLLEMARDTGTFMGLLASEIQRATLPHSAYGELAFQLSGYAINALRQGIETVLAIRLQAMETIYLQIANLLYDQYRTGFFEPMELSGVGRGRKYFSQTITQEQLEGSCNFKVELVTRLPQDEMAKMTMAQMQRQGPTPLFADNWIRDNTLAIQDSEEAASQVKAQMSEHALPEAGLYSLMMAAEEQGRSDLAAFYYQALVQLLGAKMGVLPPGTAAPPPGGGGEGGAGAAPPGASPTVRPQAALGTSPSPFTSNAGPARVAPSTPRTPRQGG